MKLIFNIKRSFTWSKESGWPFVFIYNLDCYRNNCCEFSIINRDFYTVKCRFFIIQCIYYRRKYYNISFFIAGTCIYAKYKLHKTQHSNIYNISKGSHLKVSLLFFGSLNFKLLLYFQSYIFSHFFDISILIFLIVVLSMLSY